MESFKVLNIIQDSIVDGVGMRATIFFAGCPHKCKGCHNPESWNIEYGDDYTVQEVIDEIKDNPLTSGVTLSGGDPLYQSSSILPLVKKLKKMGYNIWVYTGYVFEDILKNKSHKELISCCDVLVDGRFEKEKKDLSLGFRGSSNQRIIDIKKSLASGKIVLWKRS